VNNRLVLCGEFVEGLLLPPPSRQKTKHRIKSRTQTRTQSGLEGAPTYHGEGMLVDVCASNWDSIESDPDQIYRRIKKKTEEKKKGWVFWARKRKLVVSLLFVFAFVREGGRQPTFFARQRLATLCSLLLLCYAVGGGQGKRAWYCPLHGRAAATRSEVNKTHAGLAQGRRGLP
jgi:hypothetical protein